MSRSIKRDFHYLSVVTIVIAMALLSTFWIFLDYQTLQTESQHIRERNMSMYQNMLMFNVNQVVSSIKYEQSTAEEQLKNRLKCRVYEGVQIIKGILSENREMAGSTKLTDLIKASLRNVRFNKGRGYYFAVNLNGTGELSPIYPEFEGRNMLPLRTNTNRSIVQEMIEEVQANHEGFIKYNWSKPGKSEREYPKLSFVTLILELNWILGAGEYLDDFTSETQERVVNRVEQVRFGKDKKNYIFVTSYDGVGKSFPAKDRNVLEIKDANGVYIVKELIKQAKDGGGFVQYVMPKLGGVDPKPKLSYAAPISEWEWYIGAGVYIDEIDSIIEKNREIFKNQVKKHLSLTTFVLCIILFIHFFISHFFSRNVWQQIELFSDFFHKARTESVKMEDNRLDYKEFKTISSMANEMLEERDAILHEIKLSRDEWVNTFNAIGDCILLLDKTGRIEKINKAACAFTDRSAEDLIGSPLQEICSAADPVNLTLQDHLPHTAEVIDQKRNKVFIASCFPLFDEAGQLQRIIHIAHDITEQKELENRLIQSQKMESLGTLAGGIAHDFNNVLAAIIGNTELAELEASAGRPVTKYLSQILLAGTRAKDLVTQILTFSREVETEKSVIQPSAVLKETLSLLRSSLPTTITIEQEIDAKCGLIYINPTQFHQIVMNICTNAYHAMEDRGGTLSISLTQGDLDQAATSQQANIKPGKFVQLSITDQGKGIEPEILDRIFEPFFSTKEIGRGTGLGLSIVDSIVKTGNGFITCTSKVHYGTTFTINLPVYDSLEVDGLEHSVQPDLQVSGHILFIDDEEMLVEMSKELLEQQGLTVTAHSSSIEALAAFKKDPGLFDLIITDQTMPEMTGLDIAKQILAIRPDIPIILCSGYSSTVSAQKAKEIGIRDLAMKPLMKKDLMKKIQKELYTSPAMRSSPHT